MWMQIYTNAIRGVYMGKSRIGQIGVQNIVSFRTKALKKRIKSLPNMLL